ncbi:hypothetical protein IW261DRAFT_1424401 [Armillaria novae-zelandiae]|uniref:Uncharacterized protein n=1 Tax=Armillaria novae-zelandiae TaxID=153914 RepID=A0AA39T8X7_9AGAR|nr:hypothetical protein IW261DRAFT_1424401 [Armillaria novae-zelandiae]
MVNVINLLYVQLSKILMNHREQLSGMNLMVDVQSGINPCGRTGDGHAGKFGDFNPIRICNALESSGILTKESKGGGGMATPSMSEQSDRPARLGHAICPNFVPTSITGEPSSVQALRLTYIEIIGGPDYTIQWWHIIHNSYRMGNSSLLSTSSPQVPSTGMFGARHVTTKAGHTFYSWPQAVVCQGQSFCDAIAICMMHMMKAFAPCY